MCTVTHRDGRVTQLDQVRRAVSLRLREGEGEGADTLYCTTQVYIRGPSVRFYVVPDMLSQAPMYARSL